MKKMPARDVTGNCRGECRDRVFEGEEDRQRTINQEMKGYSEPSPETPTWTRDRKEPPGSMGGRV